MESISPYLTSHEFISGNSQTETKHRVFQLHIFTHESESECCRELSLWLQFETPHLSKKIIQKRHWDYPIGDEVICSWWPDNSHFGASLR